MKKQILLALYASLWEAKPLLPASITSIQELFEFLDQQLVPTFDDDAFDTFQEDQAQAALYLSVRLDK